jgi:phospholipid/cholesterol/gamma-HCH transport system substrate-binding protein
MRRSSTITWEELRVGALILAALVVLAIAVVKLGEAANLFTRRYALVTFLGNANGLRQGGSVTVAGQLAGYVDRIDLLPPGADTTRHIKVVMQIDAKLRPQIRGDSRARLRTLGLLGDKIIDISPGTLRYAMLAQGDTLPSEATLDYEQMLEQASSAVGDLVQLTHSLRAISDGMARGEGTMGQLLTNRSLYDQLTGSLSRLNALLVRMESSQGTLGRLMDDPKLYDHLLRTTAQLDTTLGQLRSPQGTLGRLLADDTLYSRMLGATVTADSVLKLMIRGNGFAARMLTDQDLYDRLNKTLTDLNVILEDLRRNPGRYTKGMVKVF